MAGRLRHLAVILTRTLHFVMLVLPVMLHYKLAVFAHGRRRKPWHGRPGRELNQVLAPLHRRYAPIVVSITRRMRGLYLYLAQEVVARGRPQIPQAYVDALSELVDDPPTRPWPQVKALVEAEIGLIKDRFDAFDEQPVKSGPLGQIHSATLKGGRPVLVQIQIKWDEAVDFAFKVDYALFSLTLSRFIGPQATDMLRKIDWEVMEASAGLLFRDSKQLRVVEGQFQEFSSIAVPTPIDSRNPDDDTLGSKGLCTRNVLVAELPSNFVGVLSTMTPDAFMRWVYSTKLSDGAASGGSYFLYPDSSDRPPIPPMLLESLAAIGEMIFNVGMLNANPCMSNFMLLGNGRAGAIEWSSVVNIPVDQRCLLAELCLAVADKDEVSAARIYRSFGATTLLDLDYTFAFMARTAFAPSFHYMDRGLRDQFEAVWVADQLTHQAEDSYIATFRNFQLVQDMIVSLGFPEFATAEALRKPALAYLKKENRRYVPNQQRAVPVPGPLKRFLIQGVAGAPAFDAGKPRPPNLNPRRMLPAAGGLGKATTPRESTAAVASSASAKAPAVTTPQRYVPAEKVRHFWNPRVAPIASVLVMFLMICCGCVVAAWKLPQHYENRWGMSPENTLRALKSGTALGLNAGLVFFMAHKGAVMRLNASRGVTPNVLFMAYAASAYMFQLWFNSSMPTIPERIFESSAR